MLTLVPDVGGACPTTKRRNRSSRRASPSPTVAPPTPAYPQDTVAFTSPGKRSQVASGTTVTIYRSDGTPKPTRHHGGDHGGNHHGGNHGNNGGNHGGH